ncbi:transmembrane protein 25 [Varanus komodoensis]|uniref:transmembrane protein 25 n=1 Tax=Varanus komodoensis TaxID=61221 RepID=UPI001CF7DA99|nr:transmembrane protein 25 [Varanus komodoensis]
MAGRGALSALRFLLPLLLPLETLLPAPGGAEPEAAGDGRVFSCRAAAPSLAWYLDGVRPQRNGSGKLLAAGEESGRGAFEVTLDRQLNCSATDPRGRVSSASVLLNVQFKPELVRMDAGYAEAREPGLLLVLLVLVQANPPANITWVDQDGQVMVSTSTFLLVDTKTYPWPTNHTVQVQLSSLVQNLSSSAATDVGRTPSSVLLPALLDARIELPLLALVGVSVAALGALLCLGACISCVVYQKGRKAAGIPPPAPPLPRDSDDPRPTATRLPRTIMSLPSNLQLNDLPPESKAQVKASDAPAEQEGRCELEDNLALRGRGLGQFPLVGYIYRASSMSSDEIWL